MYTEVLSFWEVVSTVYRGFLMDRELYTELSL